MMRLLFYFTLVLLMLGCDVKPDTCKDQASRTMKVFFYAVSVTGNKRSAIEISLNIVKIKNDSKSLLDTTKVSKIALSLFQEKDSMAFNFSINRKDTLTISNTTVYVKYKPDRVFENYKCGFRTNFVLDNVSADTLVFDSIKIVQPYITDVYQENCKFYLNPSVK